MVSTDLTAIEATRGRRGVVRDLLGALFVAGARTALTFLAVLVEPSALTFWAYALVVAFLWRGTTAGLVGIDQGYIVISVCLVTCAHGIGGAVLLFFLGLPRLLQAPTRVSHGSGLAGIESKAGTMQSARAALAIGHPQRSASDSDGSLNAVHQRERYAQSLTVFQNAVAVLVVMVTVSVAFHR